MPEERDTRELVAATLAGDDEAARSLLRELYPLVAKIVRAHRPVRTPEEDLCQMISIKVFRKLPQFRGDVPLAHWVSRVAVNSCLNALAAEKSRPELRRADLSEKQCAVLDDLARTDSDLAPDTATAARDLVDQLLGCLAPADRLVIEWLHLEQRTVAEIAKLTGWNTALVKVRAFRARKRLQQEMTRLRKEEDGDR